MSGDLEVYLEYFSELCEQLQESKSLDYEDMGRFVYAENAINERLKASGGATPGAFAEFIEKQRSMKKSWEKRDWELYNRLKNPESGGEVIMASAHDPGANLSARERSQSDGSGSARSPGSGRAPDGAVVDSIFGHVRTLEGIATSLSCKDPKEPATSEVSSTKPSQPYTDSANYTFAVIEPECATPGSRSARQLTARLLEEGMSQFNMEEYHKAQDDRRLHALGLTPRGPRVPSLPLQEITPQRAAKERKASSSRRAYSPACPVLDAVAPAMHGANPTQAVPVSAWPAAQATVVNATPVTAEAPMRSVPRAPDAVTATVVAASGTKNSARGKCAVWLKGGGVERPSSGLRRSQSAITVARSRSSLSEPEAEAEIREVRAPSSRAATPKRSQRGSGKEVAQAHRFSQAAQIGDLYQEIKALREEKNSEVEQLRSECRGLRLALQKTQGELQKAQGEIKELKEEASLKRNIRDKDVFSQKENQDPLDTGMDPIRITEITRKEMHRMRTVKESCDRALSMCR
eukprot:gnl/MRDRNA2_/MRDRNA2_93621_c0_seq1.p1 gnl/MRDRNA2_/MRDRNA2_93621_c0~~gnl/MRDRNA2_/MRDRNA2_93621_c0_seq1.p1  ORF type:complete len:520 (+),score=110.71 gnl/MRDRNA2_/MRDRNA2_93621_c0_seq1:78-1637(+)